MEPLVITEEQVKQLMALLSEETQASGGNYRNIQKLNERTIYKFENLGGAWVAPAPPKTKESESFASTMRMLSTSTVVALTSLAVIF